MNQLMFLLTVVSGLAVLGAIGYFVWPKVASMFRDSETLAFARIQSVIGGVWVVLTAMDLAPVFNVFGLGEYFPTWLLVSGIVTETLRRLRAPELKK